MHEINQATSTEINRLHQLATKTATEAVGYAKQAGELLLNVKDQLPYGVFGDWIEQDLTVSARQAQRYMAAAQGERIPIRELASDYDTVSHLPSGLTPAEAASIIDGTWTPKWKPEVGHWYSTDTKQGAYWVVPDMKLPDRFHVSRLYSNGSKNDGNLFDGTRWAESADRVEISLKLYQLAGPDKAIWNTYKKTGLDAPFGAPEHHGKFKVIAKDGREKWISDAS